MFDFFSIKMKRSTSSLLQCQSGGTLWGSTSWVWPLLLMLFLEAQKADQCWRAGLLVTNRGVLTAQFQCNYIGCFMQSKFDRTCTSMSERTYIISCQNVIFLFRDWWFLPPMLNRIQWILSQRICRYKRNKFFPRYLFHLQHHLFVVLI